MDSRDALRRIVKQTYITGDFILTHGNRATDYFDLSGVFLNAYSLHLVCRELEKLLLAVHFDAIGCIELCPAPLIGALLSSTAMRCQHGFIVRKVSKGYGTNKSVEGFTQSNSGVVIIEDVIATGQSALKAIHAMEEMHCEVRAVVAIIDRLEGSQELLCDYNILSVFTKGDLL